MKCARCAQTVSNCDKFVTGCSCMTIQQTSDDQVRHSDQLAAELVVDHVRRLNLDRKLTKGSCLCTERELVQELGVDSRTRSLTRRATDERALARSRASPGSG